LDALRLSGSLQRKQRIVIFGDYHCDGVTATSILLRFFHETTPIRPRWQLPNRSTDHYGSGLDTVKRILAAGKPVILIALNCGTNSGEAVRFLRANGVGTRRKSWRHCLRARTSGCRAAIPARFRR
jgi:single-stranded-DNA-specific exonuclease